MEINIERIGGKNKVTFTGKGRTFILDYELDINESQVIVDALKDTLEHFRGDGGD